MNTRLFRYIYIFSAILVVLLLTACAKAQAVPTPTNVPTLTPTPTPTANYVALGTMPNLYDTPPNCEYLPDLITQKYFCVHWREMNTKSAEVVNVGEIQYFVIYHGPQKDNTNTFLILINTETNKTLFAPIQIKMINVIYLYNASQTAFVGPIYIKITNEEPWIEDSFLKVVRMPTSGPKY